MTTSAIAVTIESTTTSIAPTTMTPDLLASHDDVSALQGSITAFYLIVMGALVWCEYFTITCFIESRQRPFECTDTQIIHFIKTVRKFISKEMEVVRSGTSITELRISPHADSDKLTVNNKMSH
jgi:hypothetical protein